jgi:DNA helicase-2/ATP-dependent DNA helicase PcrA
MRDERVQEFYGLLKYYYLKPDSDWTDKAKAMRTIAHDFYNEITHSYGTFADALKEFFKWSKINEVSKSAFALKDRLNDVVHHNTAVDKATYITFYSMIVRLIYLATDVLPDEATMEFIGCTSSDELAGLNDEQKDAVLCDAPLIYVSAGPGTGKTHLLINKLLHYISASSTPEKIVALSYTNTAANELGERFRKAAFDCGTTKPYEFYNGTLHSFCFKMMKSFFSKTGKDFNYIVIDDNDIEDLSDEFRIQLNDEYTKDEIKAALKSKLKARDPRLRELITELKKRYNIISIDDILTLFIDELSEPEFRSWFKGQVSVLVIDEAQDLSELNYRIFDLLLQVNPGMKVFLVGDSRQNIFGFNGGSYEYLDRFLQRHSDYNKKNLTGTYRCPQPVCDYVNTFHFIDCENTPLRSIGGTTGTVRLKSYNEISQEAQSVVGIVQGIGDLNNTAILCNNLKYLAPLLDQLIQQGIPYRVFGGQKIVKRHIKLFNHLLRILDSDNAYSINAIDRAFMLHIDRMPGRNAAERLYNTSGGRTLKEIKEDIAKKQRDQENLSMQALAATLIEHFFQNEGAAAIEDLETLKEMMGQYNTIEDFLLSFAIDREAFSKFLERNYVECPIPITDKFLTVSTIHSAKGLEWKNVIIMGLSEGNFPNTWFDRDKSDIEKAKSLNDAWKSMFVAATRTKGDLYLTYSSHDARGYLKSPSRFLNGLKSY